MKNLRYAYVECENAISAKDKIISDMYQSFVERLSITLKTVEIIGIFSLGLIGNFHLEK